MSFKRSNGGYIGNFTAPTSGSATGFFSTAEVSSYQRQNQWPVVPLSVAAEYLVIAGGGGAGSDGGGGGGAGGYRSSVRGESSGGGTSAESPIIIYFNVPYSISIGAGGNSTDGSDSNFSSVSAIGGGRGLRQDAPGNGGGSGGGGPTRWPPGNRAGGAGLAGQGYAGGTATNYDNLMAIGGGGGGAGAAGSNTSGANAGNGGTGVSSSITGTAVTRGGGGGGGAQFYPTSQGGCGCGSPGTGGTGGGGNAAPMTAGATGDNGTANTGGGAGAGSGRAFQSPGSTPGNGGSGIVIVRVPGICIANFSAGLTVTEIRYGEVVVYSVTQGTGTVTFVPNT